MTRRDALILLVGAELGFSISMICFALILSGVI